MSNDNKATMREAIYIMYNSVVMFNDDSSITNVHNNAMAGGGIIAKTNLTTLCLHG